jgi:hypothetical protein
MTTRTRVRRAFAALALTLAVLSAPVVLPPAVPGRKVLAQEEWPVASPIAEPPSEEVPTPEPTSEPTETSVPAENPPASPTTPPMAEPTEAPTATAPAVPVGIAAATPPGRATAVPSAQAAAKGSQAGEPRSATATDGGTGITPDRSRQVAPNTTVNYSHTVTNRGRSTDYKNITATSSNRWTVELLDADGITPLTDHNGDGIPDTGPLARHQKSRIVVRVTVPAAAPAGVKDETTVTAASALFKSRTSEDTATDRTKVSRVLTLNLDTTEVDLGQIAGDGRLDGVAPGVTSEVDDQGAYYVKEQAIRVIVTASVPWSGSCVAAENSGTATDVTVANGRLQWRLSGTTDWTAFPATDSDATDGCFPSPALGTTTYVYDVRLRVERADGPGTFRSTVTFTVSP